MARLTVEEAIQQCFDRIHELEKANERLEGKVEVLKKENTALKEMQADLYSKQLLLENELGLGNE